MFSLTRGLNVAFCSVFFSNSKFLLGECVHLVPNVYEFAEILAILVVTVTMMIIIIIIIIIMMEQLEPFQNHSENT
jgi:uncharacterized membrane protein YcjF (UPF0283 family)